jgi:hypothetical protein
VFPGTNGRPAETRFVWVGDGSQVLRQGARNHTGSIWPVRGPRGGERGFGPVAIAYGECQFIAVPTTSLHWKGRTDSWRSSATVWECQAPSSPKPRIETRFGDCWRHQRTVRKNARISLANSAGCSRAGKCPPRSILVQRVIFPYMHSASDRGGRRKSFGNSA